VATSRAHTLNKKKKPLALEAIPRVDCPPFDTEFASFPHGDYLVIDGELPLRLTSFKLRFGDTFSAIVLFYLCVSCFLFFVIREVTHSSSTTRSVFLRGGFISTTLWRTPTAIGSRYCYHFTPFVNSLTSPGSDCMRPPWKTFLPY
jgi:hypothetical protein